MSDSLDWIPIGIWSGFACVQLGTAIYDGWKNRKSPTGYSKIEKGETVNDWKIAIPRTSLLEKSSDEYSITMLSWPVDGDESMDLGTTSRFSLVIWFRLACPDGRCVFIIARFSLLSPELYETIVQVICEKNEIHGYGGYITDRIVVATFWSQENPLTYRLLLVDVITKSYQLFRIGLPDNDATLFMISKGDVAKRRLTLLFERSESQRPDDAPDDDNLIIWRREFINASYELPIDQESEEILNPISWQSISIPLGDRVDWSLNTNTYHPPMAILHQENDDVTDLDDFLPIVFGGRENWKIESLASWLENFRSTEFGAKWMKAVKDFGALEPPDYRWSNIKPLPYFDQISPFQIDGAVFTGTPCGILRRFLHPPSLMRQAAEEFCRSNPGFDFGQLKKAIGFDIFDGMYVGEKKVKVIYL